MLATNTDTNECDTDRDISSLNNDIDINRDDDDSINDVVINNHVDFKINDRRYKVGNNADEEVVLEKLVEYFNDNQNDDSTFLKNVSLYYY